MFVDVCCQVRWTVKIETVIDATKGTVRVYMSLSILNLSKDKLKCQRCKHEEFQ